MPMPVLQPWNKLSGRVSRLDYLIATGTHSAMNDDQLSRHLGRKVVGGVAGDASILNHVSDVPEALVTLGVIPAAEISEISEGRLQTEVTVV